MTLEIRRLDPVADIALFEQCYDWLLSGPRWRRETEAVFGPLDRTAWLAATHALGRVDVGVFSDGVLVADVVLILQGQGLYEVHLDARRGTSPNVVVEAGRTIRDQMFSHGMQWAFMWVPKWNRAVRSINKAIGFKPDNVSMLRSTSSGRLVEWQRYSIVR